MTWPQAVVLFVCALLAIAAGLWAVLPGVVEVWVPMYVEDPRDVEGGIARTEPMLVEVRCPGLFGVLETSADRAMRQMASREPPGSYLREREDQRAPACAESQRRHLVWGLPVMVGSVVSGAVLVLLSRGRGPAVVVPPHRFSDQDVAVLAGAAFERCRRCGRPRTRRPPSIWADLDGSARLCGSCLTSRRVHASVLTLAISIACLVVGTVLAWAGDPFDIATSLLVVGSLTPLLYAQVGPHELGHALVARVLGLRVLEVSVGIGARVATVDVGATRVSIRAIPAAGHTSFLSQSAVGFRVRNWLAIASGPAVSLVIMALAFRWDAGATGPASAIRWVIIGSAAWILVTNLAPLSVRGAPSEAHTDGWHLVRIPFLSPEQVRTAVATHRALLAVHTARRGHTLPDLSADDRELLDRACSRGDLLAHLTRVSLLATDRSWAEAATAARTMLEEPPGDEPLSDQRRAHLLNVIAWSRVAAGEVEPSDEADLCSAQALLLLPDEAAVRGTRGSVLVEIGRAEEGLALLRQALAEPPDDTNEALDLCYVAIGEAACGRTEEAHLALQAALDLDPSCYLLDRARSRVPGRPA